MSYPSEHPSLPLLGRLLTLDEWAALDEDEPGELVDGRLEEEEVPDVLHEVVVSWLIGMFRNWLMGRGWVLGSEAKYAVQADRGRKPDVAVYLRRDLQKLPRTGIVRVAPDIAVEVVSPSPRDERRDRIEKMDEYAAFGVHFYWIVDPSLQSLEIFELTGGRYARAARGTEGTMNRVPGCEGLVVNLEELWKELSELERE
jgi:Uma2 family endonuclease